MQPNFLDEFEFFTGVPDSLLKPFCDHIMAKHGVGSQHIVAANEGNAVALAAGYHLATGKIPVVYLQNSGLGNVINPVASLMNDHVYAIPAIFVIGWRGEPGISDEPQHIYQGKITLQLLDIMNIAYCILDSNSSREQIMEALEDFRPLLKAGKQVAFVVRKGAFENDAKILYKNDAVLLREEAIRQIMVAAGDDVIVCTTGKASRELFELREQAAQGHRRDFLTVGSMGHSSSIALGIALQQPYRKLWIIDGDGASLMHMGSMAVLGACALSQTVHIVLNNGAHETVGGIPTVAGHIDFSGIAKACGYEQTFYTDDAQTLEVALKQAAVAMGKSFIEVKCALGSRSDLGRPTTAAIQNKISLMEYLSNS